MASAKCSRRRLPRADLRTRVNDIVKGLLNFVAACLLLTSSMGLRAQDSAVDALHTVLINVESLQGTFTQKQYGEEGDLLEQSSGQFHILRPGFFRWEITHPDSQLIIADPNYLWHHDRDLETVTSRPASEQGEMAPLRVLGGSRSALVDSFTVTRGEADTYVLEPREPDAGFQRVTLAFHDGTLTGMTVNDDLQQTVTIEFFEVDTETALTPADFAFTPPQDADLFYYDE